MASPSASDRPDSDANSFPTPAPPPEAPAAGLSLARASEQLIQRFGGIRPMANKLEVPFTTVQGWKKRGAIPAARLNDLRAAAQRHGIALEDAELEALARSDDRHPEGARGAVPPGPQPEPAPEPPVEESSPPPTEPSSPSPPADEGGLPPFEVEPVPEPAPVPVATSAPAPAAAVAVVAETEPTVGPPPVPDEPPVPPFVPANPPVVSGAVRLSLAAAALALIAAAVAILGPPLLHSPASPSVVAPRLNDLESSVLRVAAQQDSRNAVIEKQIGALDARISRTATQQSAEALAARLAILEQDLPALQRQVSAGGLGSPTLADLLAANELRRQLDTAAPFLAELEAFRMTAFNDPALKQALDQIANRGKAGIPTQAWLVGRFAVVAPNIVRAAAWDHPEQRVADIFLDLLSDWVPPLYRLTGVPQGSSPRAVTERAQAWMAAGDFSRAVELLGELADKPAEAAMAWLAEARARVIADHARDLLGKHIQALAEPGAPPP